MVLQQNVILNISITFRLVQCENCVFVWNSKCPKTQYFNTVCYLFIFRMILRHHCVLLTIVASLTIAVHSDVLGKSISVIWKITLFCQIAKVLKNFSAMFPRFYFEFHWFPSCLLFLWNLWNFWDFFDYFTSINTHLNIHRFYDDFHRFPSIFNDNLDYSTTCRRLSGL